MARAGLPPLGAQSTKYFVGPLRGTLLLRRCRVPLNGPAKYLVPWAPNGGDPAPPILIEIHVPHAAAARLMRLRQETWSGKPDTCQVFLENDEILKNVLDAKFLLHKFG